MNIKLDEHFPVENLKLEHVPFSLQGFGYKLTVFNKNIEEGRGHILAELYFAESEFEKLAIKILAEYNKLVCDRLGKDSTESSLPSTDIEIAMPPVKPPKDCCHHEEQ